MITPQVITPGDAGFAAGFRIRSVDAMLETFDTYSSIEDKYINLLQNTHKFPRNDQAPTNPSHVRRCPLQQMYRLAS